MIKENESNRARVKDQKKNGNIKVEKIKVKQIRVFKLSLNGKRINV